MTRYRYLPKKASLSASGETKVASSYITLRSQGVVIDELIQEIMVKSLFLPDTALEVGDSEKTKKKNPYALNHIFRLGDRQ